MPMHAWLLPEAIEDLLPAEAAQVEILRRRLLDDFLRHGYQLVAPPLLEFADALLEGDAGAISVCALSSSSTNYPAARWLCVPT